MKKRLRVLNVVGARPNFMKIAPIIREMKKYHEKIKPLLLHTGQHFDREMSMLFFEELRLPEPDFYLGVGSGSHAEQTAKIINRFEGVLLKSRPDLVLVVGDVNSSLACALCAAKLRIPVAHVEAGLRSFDRSMPEEINRVLTDSISDYLFTTEESANVNLLKEGLKKTSIYFVGNVMIDTLMANKKKAADSAILERLRLKKGKYAILTLHRPGNVDDKDMLLNIIRALREVQKGIRVVWPIHPRAKKAISRFKINGRITGMSNLKIVPAMGYLDFLRLMTDSKFALTDSGGIQEESTILNVPCLTLRRNTERPVTVEEGTNIIVGQDADRIVKESTRIISGRFKKGRTPRFWDGRAAERIVRILIKESGNGTR